MSASVFVLVEDGDEEQADTWFILNNFDTFEEALEEAKEVCAQYTARTGVMWEQLDGD